VDACLTVLSEALTSTLSDGELSDSSAADSPRIAEAAVQSLALLTNMCVGGDDAGDDVREVLFVAEIPALPLDAVLRAARSQLRQVEPLRLAAAGGAPVDRPPLRLEPEAPSSTADGVRSFTPLHSLMRWSAAPECATRVSGLHVIVSFGVAQSVALVDATMNYHRLPQEKDYYRSTLAAVGLLRSLTPFV
jgi:hypothetical protein